MEGESLDTVIMKILARLYNIEPKEVQELVATLPVLLDKERKTAKAEVESAGLRASRASRAQAPAPPLAPSAAVQNELRQAQAEIDRLKARKNSHDSHIVELKAQITELNAQIKAFHAEATKQEAQLARKDEQLAVLHSALSDHRPQMSKKAKKAIAATMAAVEKAQNPKSKKTGKNDSANGKEKKGGKKGKQGTADQTEVEDLADPGVSVTALGDSATSRDAIKTFNTDGSHIASEKAHGAGPFSDPLGASSVFRFGGSEAETSYPRSKRAFDAGLGESGNTPKKIKTESAAAAGGHATAATPKCRRCKKYALTCDSRSRCCHCEVADQRCIYEACPLGLWCKGKRCDEIHDGQWTHEDVPAWNIEKPRAPLDTLGPYHTSTAWVPQTTREASQTSSSAHETASTGNNLSPTA